MGRYYDKLFSLEIDHDYYNLGKSHDFAITPAKDTLKLIKGLRCMYKHTASLKTPKGTAMLSVSFESIDNSQTPLLPIQGNQLFRFGMKLINPGFLNFTSLAAKSNSEVYYYTNISGNILTQSTIELRPKLLLYQFTFPDPLTVFKLKGPDGNYLSEFETSLSGGPDYEISLDLTNHSDGKYTIELFNGAILEESKLIYFDNSFLGAGVFGIIEINKTNNSTNSFTIEYNKKSANWKYFVVIRNGQDAEDYSIVDTGTSPATFTLVPSPSPGEQLIIDALLAEIPDGEVVLFNSDSIDYTETKRKDIQLRKNNQSSPPVISHLPNPSVQKSGPEIFVYV